MFQNSLIAVFGWIKRESSTSAFNFGWWLVLLEQSTGMPHCSGAGCRCSLVSETSTLFQEFWKIADSSMALHEAGIIFCLIQTINTDFVTLCLKTIKRYSPAPKFERKKHWAIAMQSFKKAAKSVALSANKVHPLRETESQDADSEMAQPPRRRRQSFSRDVRDADRDSSSTKGSPDISSTAARRPSIEARLTPTARASPVLSSFRRRSLSNGSVGSEMASPGRKEQAPGDRIDAVKHSSVQDDSSSHQLKAYKKVVALNTLRGDHISESAPRKDAQQIQSMALQRFFSSAQKSNNWSAASKKMIFGSDIDDAKLQNRAKLESRCSTFPHTFNVDKAFFCCRFHTHPPSGVCSFANCLLLVLAFLHWLLASPAGIGGFEASLRPSRAQLFCFADLKRMQGTPWFPTS